MLFKILCINIISIIYANERLSQLLPKAIWIWLFPNIRYDGQLDKPFRCPMCLTFWLSLIYVLFFGKLTLGWMGLIILIAYMSDVTADMLRLAKDIITKLIDWIYGKIK